MNFGVSRFQCLGMQVAKFEILKCVAEVVRRFDMRIAGTAEMGGPIKTDVSYGIFMQKGIETRVERR